MSQDPNAYYTPPSPESIPPFEQPVQYPPPAGMPPEKKSNKTLIIILVIVAVLLLCCCCGAIGWFLWNNGDQIIEQLEQMGQLLQFIV